MARLGPCGGAARGCLAGGALLLALAGCAGGAPVDRPPQAGAEEPFFVGLWAASEAACAETPWRFTRQGLATPGEVVCSFDETTAVPGGYRIEATCTAEGPPAPFDILLTPAQSAQGLLVEGAPFRDIGLVACPEEGA